MNAKAAAKSVPKSQWATERRSTGSSTLITGTDGYEEWNNHPSTNHALLRTEPVPIPLRCRFLSLTLQCISVELRHVNENMKFIIDVHPTTYSPQCVVKHWTTGRFLQTLSNFTPTTEDDSTQQKKCLMPRCTPQSLTLERETYLQRFLNKIGSIQLSTSYILKWK